MTTQKIALVTGANKGLGKEIARQLGKQGFTVIVGARDEAAGKKAVDELAKDGVTAEAIKLEVTNPDHVASAAKFIGDKYGKLDLLVNNAGISLDWDGTPMTADKMRKTYEVNVIGQWQVTEGFVPLLSKSDDARVINHSSILGSISSAEKMWEQMGAMCGEAYSTSKAALDMLTLITSNKLKPKNIFVTAAHPGWVKTDLGSDAAPMDVTDGAKTAVALATMPRD
jgi:NAD(P)-dependent dehydrogenase (short-subunit alcohol dehydrogenase family)